MYVVDGISYSGDPKPVLQVVAVYPLDGWQLRVRFSTGEVKRFDFVPLLNAPCFQPLRDPAVFQRIGIECGGPVWCDGAIDIAPEKLYQDGVLEDC